MIKTHRMPNFMRGDSADGPGILHRETGVREIDPDDRVIVRVEAIGHCPSGGPRVVFDGVTDHDLNTPFGIVRSNLSKFFDIR